MAVADGVWHAVRRFIGSAGSQVMRSGGSRLRGFYRWTREQVMEARRNNEMLLQEETRHARRAQRRALTLLMGLLSPAQREEFRASRQFHVIGGGTGTRYRIRAAALVNIDVIGSDGTVTHRLCAHPAGDVPLYDVMAAQMLHLQDPVTEQRFLQQAYVHSVVPGVRIRAGTAWTV